MSFREFASELQPRKSFLNFHRASRLLSKEGRPCSHWPGLFQGSCLIQLPLRRPLSLSEFLIDLQREHQSVYNVESASRHGTSPTLPNRLLAPLPSLQRLHPQAHRKHLTLSSRMSSPPISPPQRRGAGWQSPNASPPSWTTCKATSS